MFFCALDRRAEPLSSWHPSRLARVDDRIDANFDAACIALVIARIHWWPFSQESVHKTAHTSTFDAQR